MTMRAGRAGAVVVLSGFFTALLALHAFAFETPTHQLVNQVALQQAPAVDDVLKTQLGMIRGIESELIDRRTIAYWTGMGGAAEDELYGIETFGGITRSPRHFHTPLRPFDRAGLGGLFESSARWAQNRRQFPGGRASWFDAREAFHAALTNPDPAARNRQLADTFRIVGQLMHLLADLASPAHTRDDNHVLGDPFEAFMKDARNVGLIQGRIGFDARLLGAGAADPVAALPIARLWDGDRYDGTNPPDAAAGATFGLAEFTSSNFFSNETINVFAAGDPVHPLPAVARLDVGAVVNGRRYLTKTGDGVPVERMVAEGLFFKFSRVPLQLWTLDDVVFADYARHLLPRAVGYSATLLEHFFRGRIEIAAPGRYAYAVTPFVEGNSGTFRKLTFRVRNVTPNDEAAGSGQMVAIVRYRQGFANLIENPIPISSQLSYAVSRSQTVTLGRQFTEVTFDFSDSPIPANAADLFLTVVHRGPLGGEPDAVMVGGKDLFEPDPVDVVNGTDWACFGNELYFVADATAFPPYAPPAQRQRDVNGDGVQDLFGPSIERGVFAKVFDPFGFLPAPSETNFDLAVMERAPAQYTRFMLLQDQPVYGLAWLTREDVDVPTGGVVPDRFTFVFAAGVRNQVFVGPDGGLIRRVTLPSLYRGTRTLNLHVFVANIAQYSALCLAGSAAKTPPIARVEGTTPTQ